MTDILCPVCGVANSPEADSCKSCQAPLKTSAFTPDFADDSDIPDWLRKLTSDQSDQPASSLEEGQAAFPDWLRKMGDQSGFEQPAESPQEPADESPDWLSDVLQEAPSQSVEPEEEQDWAAGWLAEAQKNLQPESDDAAAPLYTFDDLQASDLPAAQPPEPDQGDGLLSTLPDWVAGVTAEQPQGEAPEDPSGLTPAELPGWLAAMRPTEAEVASRPTEDVSGATVENSGPLIGLRGVLSGEPVTIKSHRPAAYSLKLRVTDEQKQRVALLEQLLAEEPRPKVLPAAPVITAQYIVRLLIALALLLPVAWTVIQEGRLVPLPTHTEVPGVLALYQIIEQMPDHQPVLVAFDYEAGYSGEMDAAASMVLEHLKGRSAHLALVSTSATGPALAERFMVSLGTHTEGLDLPFSDYSNLGYIPGGSIGLFSLARDLHQTLPYDLQGQDIWAGGALGSIQGLSDFSLVLVLVSDPETARAWVEQTGPALRQNGTPLVMVASSQAAPLVQPYFSGFPQQVQGLVAGIRGGAAYEDAVAASGPARQSWDAYSLGLMASVFVILAGVVVALFMQVYGIGESATQERR